MSLSTVARVAVCASGRGTNAEALIDYQEQAERRGTAHYAIVLILSTKAEAGCCRVAQQHGIPLSVLQAGPTDDEANAREMGRIFDDHGIDVVCLAGFMRKVPETIVQRYEGRMLNIHPSLLPKFGGHGMYGSKVFKAVLEAGETESGPSVHLVSAEYDEGRVLGSLSTAIEPGESVESLAEKTHQLEHKLYPKILENLVIEHYGSEGEKKKRNTEENL